MKEALFLILGACLSGSVGLVVDYFIRRRDAHNHFRIEMSRLRLELEGASDILGFYDTTFIRIREAISSVRPFLNEGKGKTLTGFWNTYGKARPDKAQYPDSFFDDDQLYESFGEKRPKNQKEIIQFLIRKFDESVN
jgi:hypothetical protein